MTGEDMTTDYVTSEYLKRCLSDERLRSAMSDSSLPSSFQATYRRFSPRPFFADRKSMNALGSDIKRTFDIIVSLPERLFGDDLGQYCSTIGIDEQRTALIGRLRNADPPRAGRADLYHDGSAFKILEFNVNTGLGGADVVEIYRALLAVEPFAVFAREFDLDYTDTMAAKADALREAAETVSGIREPVIAAIEADGALSTFADGFRSIQHSMARYGVRLALGELGQLKQRNGRVCLDDKPIDLILRYFTVDQIIDDASGRAAYEMICRTHEQGKVVVHKPLESHLFGDKATLALLSDHRYRNSFSRAEKNLIDRMLPWTRLLREGRTEFNAESVDLVSFSIEHQQNLILKPSAGFSGHGVVAGWETERDEWEKLLRHNVGGPFIIQQRIAPTSEPVVDPSSGRLQDVLPAWGVFFSENGYSGGVIRTAPSDGGAVINMGSNSKASITGLFTYNGRRGSGA